MDIADSLSLLMAPLESSWTDIPIPKWDIFKVIFLFIYSFIYSYLTNIY